MIVRGDPVKTALAVDACERRGLHYVLATHAAVDQARALSPWAILATGAADGLGQVCAAIDAPGACFEHPPTPGGDATGHLLVVRTDPVFTVDDDSPAVRFLDAIDAGRDAHIEPHVTWTGIYGPTLVDGVLDLLLDGVTGLAGFAPEGDLTLDDLHRELTLLARWAARPAGDGAFVAHAATLSGAVPDYMPPLETMLERFVSERRRYRGAGEVARRKDPALQAA